MKRQLNSEEKRMIQKTLKAKKADLSWIEYQIKYYELMLKEGLEQNYLKQRRDYEKMLRELKSELETNNSIDSEMRKQLKEGVDIVETKEIVEKEVKE